jgi:hypothetical protein
MSIKILSFLFSMIICTATQTINVKISFRITCSLSNKYKEELQAKIHKFNLEKPLTLCYVHYLNQNSDVFDSKNRP